MKIKKIVVTPICFTNLILVMFPIVDVFYSGNDLDWKGIAEGVFIMFTILFMLLAYQTNLTVMLKNEKDIDYGSLCKAISSVVLFMNIMLTMSLLIAVSRI